MVYYKKRILFVSGFYFPSQLGGPCNSNHWLVNALKENGFYVSVIATSAGIVDSNVKFNKWIYDENGKVIYINTNRPNFSLKVIFTFFWELAEADFVQISSLFSFSSFLPGIASVLFKKKIIWSPRGELFKPAIGTKQRLKRILIVIIRRVSKRIFFHVTSDEELSDLRYYFGNEVNFILQPNYIKLTKFENVRKKNQFVYLGRLHPIKALDNLIAALSLSQNFKNSNYRFLIVGNGPDNYKNYLNNLVIKNKLEDQVFFEQHIDDVLKKNRLYAESKFTFLISESENFGNVVLESLSNGTPVIASKGTPWKILNEKKSGFWINNDPLSISVIIDEILRMNSDGYSIFTKNAYLLAKEFDIDENIDKWIISYNSIGR